MIIHAKFVVPVIGPVIEHGAVEIRSGVIDWVGPARDVAGRVDVDYGDAVLLPGFVNAHTHLELGGMAGRVPPGPSLADWLGRLVQQAGAAADREGIELAVRVGVAQSLAAGVTCLGDITRFPAWTRPVLACSGMLSVSFGEVIAIGSRRVLLDERLGPAVCTDYTAEHLRAGISPHSTYTVEPEGLRACAEASDRMQLPLCIHLAESLEEEEFTRSRRGPLADHLRRLGVWDERIPVSGCSPVELAVRTGVLSSRTVIAHANFVINDDLTLIARSGASVAYCPRTHAAFGHAPHRLVEMREAGVNVGIGTDSLASNPDLSVLAELRFLRRHRPEIAPATLIEMGTLAGSRALGFGEITGAIAAGGRADLVAMPLPGQGDRWDAIFEDTSEPAAVYLAGELRASTSG